jgi:hypothetical protein
MRSVHSLLAWDSHVVQPPAYPAAGCKVLHVKMALLRQRCVNHDTQDTVQLLET